MQLDPRQKAAVETESTRALVIAGAGSGKTRVLVERIAFLLEARKVSPYEVMAFTFTRKSAGEMRERLWALIGRDSHKLTLGTMHAVALRMLRRFPEFAGINRFSFTVYSEWESNYLLKEVATDLGVFKKTWKIPKKDVDRVFADFYERGEEPDAEDPVRPLFEAFLARCKENNALTYGGLLIALECLIPVMAKHLRIRHILVDEVQDIDPLQWRIINGMCEAFGASLFVVGDIDQSVYAFRGAVPGYLIAHRHEFTEYLLESNYRSTQGIVVRANRLIEHNRDRISKTMRPTRSEDGQVLQFHGQDSTALSDLISTAHPPVNAVLARTHQLLKRLSQELTTREVSHVYVGEKTSLANSEESRRFHSFLKLLVNPYDNFSFLLIRELVGLSPSEYSNIRVKAATEGKSHFQAWKDSPYDDPFSAFFRNPLSSSSLTSASLMIHYMAIGSSPFPGAGWSFDDSSILQFIYRWIELNPDGGGIQEYLDWLATVDVQDELDGEEADGMTLCTIHAAKGLEWPVVVVAGCNEGILPGKQSIAAGQIEEERRLMYVAMTRARDHLILAIRPETKEGQDGKTYENPASRFILEAFGEAGANA